MSLSSSHLLFDAKLCERVSDIEPASITTLGFRPSTSCNPQSFLPHEQKIVPTLLFLTQKWHLTNASLFVFSSTVCEKMRNIFLVCGTVLEIAFGWSNSPLLLFGGDASSSLRDLTNLSDPFRKLTILTNNSAGIVS